MTMNRAFSELEAQGLVVRRQGSGTFVAPNAACRLVALVCDHDIFAAEASPFLRILLDETRRRAKMLDEKFSFFLAEPGGSNNVHDDLAVAVEAGRVGGVLFVGEANPKAISWLEERVPLVALSYIPGAAHRVRIDHAAIATQGVAALAAQGCRRIALWIPVGVGIGRSGDSPSFPELESFKSALRSHELPYDASLVWRLDELTDVVERPPRQTNQQQGLNAARAVFGGTGAGLLDGLPDGVVIDDDVMARGALTAMAQLGVEVGRDVRIASHTNTHSHVLLGYEDRLTTLEIDAAEIAAALFGALEDLMAGRQVAPIALVKPRRSTGVRDAQPAP
jgi:DNA-binding LacI/PurR family transcriptional regulator